MRIRIETKYTGEIIEVDADDLKLFWKKENPMSVIQNWQILELHDKATYMKEQAPERQTKGQCIYSKIDKLGVWCKKNNGLPGCLGAEFCENYVGEKNVIKEQVTA